MDVICGCNIQTFTGHTEVCGYIHWYPNIYRGYLDTLISKHLQGIQRYVDTYFDTQTCTGDTEICGYIDIQTFTGDTEICGYIHWYPNIYRGYFDTLISKHVQGIKRYEDTLISKHLQGIHKANIQIFIVEILIAKKASCFIDTLSSNIHWIDRYPIGLLHWYIDILGQFYDYILSKA